MSDRIEWHFPRLRGSGYLVTSPRTPAYNCIAFAAGDDSRWWEPDPSTEHFWPADARRDYSLAALVQALGTCGFETCASAALEAGWEKVAVFADAEGAPTHVARQLPDGAWTSKLGTLEDIRHRALDDVSGDAYGVPRVTLRRPIRAT